jgi:hypothetical protein
MNDMISVRVRILNLQQRAHPLDDLQGWTEKVHGMAPATETKFFGQLDDSGLEPRPGSASSRVPGRRRWRLR